MAEDVAGSAPALLQSPLHDRHAALGAKFAEFGGWSMPLEYPSGVIKEHTAVRESVGIFDVSHLGKAMVSGPGAADHINASLSNDLAKIAPGQAQYTLCCDDDRRHRRRPDRLLPGRQPRAAGAQRRQRGRGDPAPDRVGARGRQGRRPPHGVRRPRGAGLEVRRGPDRGRPPGRPRLHVVRRGRLRRLGRRRLPHGLHRRARLRADRAQRGRRRAVGPAARGRGAVRHPRLRSRRPRHPAHRDGLSTARAGHHGSTSHPTRHASAGRSAGRRTGSGAAKRSWPRRKQAPSACCAG